MSKSVTTILEEEVRVLQEWRDEIRKLIQQSTDILRQEIRDNTALIITEMQKCECSKEILAAIEDVKGEPKPKKSRGDEDPKDKGKGKDDDKSSGNSGSVAPKRPAPTGQWWYPETGVWDKPFN